MNFPAEGVGLPETNWKYDRVDLGLTFACNSVQASRREGL